MRRSHSSQNAARRKPASGKATTKKGAPSKSASQRAPLAIETWSYEPHPVAEVLPPMTDDEYRGLVDDLKVNGLRQRIVLHEGKILDGVHRYRACKEAGIMPKYTEWDGCGSPIDYVISTNRHRRHLNPSQLAAVAVDAKPFFEEKTRDALRQGQQKGGRAKRKGKSETPPISGESKPAPRRDHAKEAADMAAKAYGATRTYVNDLVKVKNSAPEVFTLAKEAKINVPMAKRLARLSGPERKVVLDKGKDEDVGYAKALKQHTQTRSEESPDDVEESLRAVLAAASDLSRRFKVLLDALQESEPKPFELPPKLIKVLNGIFRRYKKAEEYLRRQKEEEEQEEEEVEEGEEVDEVENDEVDDSDECADDDDSADDEEEA